MPLRMVIASALLCAAGAGRLGARDCNRNNTPDAQEIERQPALDCNGNGNLDACDVAAVNLGFVETGVAAVGSLASVAVGDLDGDGRLDLAGANNVGREVAVLLNQGGAAFPVTDYTPVTDTPHQIVAADLNQDGLDDVATANESSVSVWLRGSRGGFGPEAQVRIPQGLRSIRAGDLDGDRDLDLMTANVLGDNVSVLENDGSGGFAGPRNFDAGTRPIELMLADLDGDGDLDAVVVNGLVVNPRSPAGLRVLKNHGASVFAAEELFDVRFAVPTWVDAGDLDQDGDVDLAAATGNGVLGILFNSGTGSFGPAVILEDTLSNSLVMVIVRDVNGDGMLDLLGLASWYFTALLSVGHGSFAGEGFWLSGPTAVAGDLDGDGDADLATAKAEGLSVLLNQPVARSVDCDRDLVPDECGRDCDCDGVPDACETAQGAEDCNRNGALDDCEDDCNHNQRPDDCDLAAGESSDCNTNAIPDECELAWADCDADGVFDACETAAGDEEDCNGNGVPDACDLTGRRPFAGQARLMAREAFAVAAVDLDGDGAADVVTGAYEGLAVFWGEGGLDFTGPSLLSAQAWPFAVSDLDGDGDLDLCAAERLRPCWDRTGHVASYLQEPGRTFRRASVVPVEGVPLDLAAADFDGDGLQDVAASARDAVWICSGLGRGALAVSARAAAPGGRLAAADLDGDRDPDLAVGTSQPTMAAMGRVLRNEGDATFVETETFASQGGGVLPRDLDGDGDVDLATASGRLSWNDGAGRFLDRTTLEESAGSPSGGHFAIAAGDLDGDGDLDLFREQGLLLVHGNAGARNFVLAARLTSESYRASLDSADLNGDGRWDLAIASPAGVSLLRNLGEPASLGRGVSFHHGGPNWDLLDDPPGPLAGVLDLDGDRDLDLLVEAASRKLALYRNRGDGTLAPPFEIDPAGALGPMVVADLDADGAADVALGDYVAASVEVRLGDPRLLLAPGVPVPVLDSVKALVLLDADRDGDVDLAAALAGPQISLLENDGAGRFELARTFDSATHQVALLSEDFDADGDADLTAARQLGFGFAGSLAFFVNRGSGDFTPGAELPLAGAPASLKAGDADGDGRADIAITLAVLRDCDPNFGCVGGGRIAALWNEGGGKLREAVLADEYYISRSLDLHDLDGDGSLDVAFANTWEQGSDYIARGSSIGVAWNQSGRRFHSGSSFTVGEYPYTVLAADLDGSGTGDVIAISRQSVSVFLGDLASPVRDADHDGVLDECGKSATFRRGDFNADGRLDLADAIAILIHLFAGGPRGTCFQAADADDGGSVNLTDPIAILFHLFAGGGPLPEPSAGCGLDPTPDALSCERFAPCEG